MNYRKDKKGTALSVLGYGCLRFSKKNGKIDIEKTETEIMAAIDNGVNYFDTAYVYGQSEAVLGEILKRNKCREKVLIATKLPHYLIKSKEAMEKYFQEQLTRLQTDYIDYYLMHMLTDTDTWERLKGLGILSWLKEKQATGQIHNIGFSYHGNTDMFQKLIDAYDWDFCQIQYNYMDEHSQAGRKGLEYAGAKGIPVIIMEPLRGGKLVNLLPEKAKDIFAGQPVKKSPAEWALRWLWSQKKVTCILSGMNSKDMVLENCRIAGEIFPDCFTKEEQVIIEQVKAAINEKLQVGCTACGYCMPCPKGVDIPGTFRCFNVMYMEKKKTGRREYLMCTAFRKQQSSASKCVQCKKCETHCPQNIQISQALLRAKKELETPFYKLAALGVRKFRFW